MPKAGSKAIPAPRKALQEATSSELNKKRSSETTLDPTQVKKAKPSTSKTKESTTSTKSSAEAPEFVTAITLPGEEQGKVTVYDDCRTIRTKIRALLKTGVKQTHLLKWCGGINSNTYGRFMRFTGIMDGAGNGMYYAGYVFFEKKRIFEGKAKTSLRLRQEAAFRGGRDLQLESRTHVWLGPGMSCRRDDLGRLVVEGRGR